ncbi:putative cytochrome p450 family protein [Seiridium cardinale]|uniref:Cytochrome p450 family protein n=1 Tax=Seiridium cardinale TaxID=138064 RepID=A0ABR2XR75_9PEZI
MSLDEQRTPVLAVTKTTNRLGEIYYGKILEEVDSFPMGEWAPASVVQFCKYQMGRAATETLFGPQLFELHPHLLDAFWDFEAAVPPLFLGVPRWWNSKPYKARERYFRMAETYLASAFDKFEWTTRAETDWDPNFGASIFREMAKWLKDGGFSDDTAAAANTNTIPITIWGIMEISREPELFHALRQEVQGALVVNTSTGGKALGIQKLLTMPLLQSVYVECCVSTWISLEAPMQIAHHDEAVWGVPEHHASEFWAHRHIKYVESTDEAGNSKRRPEFSMAGRPSSFFTYGGGLPICPGRHFAKHEILISMGLIIAKLGIEYVG